MNTDVLVIRPHVLAAQLGVSPSTLSRWEKAGHFPAKIVVANSPVGYRFTDIKQWLECVGGENV